MILGCMHSPFLSNHVLELLSLALRPLVFSVRRGPWFLAPQDEAGHHHHHHHHHHPKRKSLMTTSSGLQVGCALCRQKGTGRGGWYDSKPQRGGHAAYDPMPVLVGPSAK